MCGGGCPASKANCLLELQDTVALQAALRSLWRPLMTAVFGRGLVGLTLLCLVVLGARGLSASSTASSSSSSSSSLLVDLASSSVTVLDLVPCNHIAHHILMPGLFATIMLTAQHMHLHWWEGPLLLRPCLLICPVNINNLEICRPISCLLPEGCVSLRCLLPLCEVLCRHLVVAASQSSGLHHVDCVRSIREWCACQRLLHQYQDFHACACMADVPSSTERQLCSQMMTLCFSI